VTIDIFQEYLVLTCIYFAKYEKMYRKSKPTIVKTVSCVFAEQGSSCIQKFVTYQHAMQAFHVLTTKSLPELC